MAQLTGAIQFQGTVGNITADKNGNLRMKPAPRAVTATRTLENNAEFGTINTAKKTFVDAFRSILGKVPQPVHNSLTRKFNEIKQLDGVSDRGQRGILDAECELLKGFDLNGIALDSVFYPYITATVDRLSGVNSVSIPAYSPLTDLSFPAGTTHYQFKAKVVAISFEGEGVIEAVEEKGTMQTLNGTPVAAVSLSALDLSANIGGVIFVAVGIDFFQEINGKKYELQNGSYNPTKVIKVTAV